MLDLSHTHLPSIDSNLLQKLTQLEFPNLSHNRLEVVTSQAWTPQHSPLIASLLVSSMALGQVLPPQTAPLASLTSSRADSPASTLNLSDRTSQ